MAAATAFAGAGWHWHPMERRDGQRQRRRCAGVEVEVEVAAAEAAAAPERIRGRAHRPKLGVDSGWTSGDACDCGPCLRQREKKRLISTQADGLQLTAGSGTMYLWQQLVMELNAC